MGERLVRQWEAEERAEREGREELAAMNARREDLAADRRARFWFTERLTRAFPHHEDEHRIDTAWDVERLMEEYRRDS